MAENLGAILTAMVTPFDAGGKLDEDAAVALMHHLVEPLARIRWSGRKAHHGLMASSFIPSGPAAASPDSASGRRS